MAVRDRTILENALNLDQVLQKQNEIENKINTIQNGVHFVGTYNTYAEMISTLVNPSDTSWVIIAEDETKSNARTQYIYSADTSEWIYAGGATSVNDATDSVKGVIRLAGDFNGGTANSPQLSTIITGGTYAFGNNTVTVDPKGRLVNIIAGSTSYEWSFASKPNTRTQEITVLTVPSYDVANATIQFFYNGLLISPNDYDRTNSTTITTHFTIRIDDDIFILNLKFIGKIDSSVIINDLALSDTTTYSSNKLNTDFAKLNDSIIPQQDATYNLGSSNFRINDLYIVNPPIVTSDPSNKRNIEVLQINALEFANNLESLQYNLLEGNRIHTGLSSTQLKSTLNEFGVDYAMYVKDADTGNEAIRYEELISILIKGLSQVTPWYKKIYYKIRKYFRRKAVVGNE